MKVVKLIAMIYGKRGVPVANYGDLKRWREIGHRFLFPLHAPWNVMDYREEPLTDVGY